MKASTLLFSIFLFSFSACKKSTQTIEIKNENGIVIERFEQNVETKQKDGRYQKFSAEGILTDESNFANGQLEGIRTLFYENGKPEYIERYRNGQLEGTYKGFHEDGSPKVEGEYVKNKMQGPWKSYYKGGTLKEIVQFQDNEEEGPFEEFFPNGNRKALGQYLGGDNEHGLLQLFNEEGTLIKKMDCQKGLCRTTWTLEGGDVIVNK